MLNRNSIPPMRAPDSGNDITLERAKLGVEAEAFLRSSLGRYMVDMAEMQIQDGLLALHSTPAGTPSRILKLE